MRFLGLEITRAKSLPAGASYSQPSNRGGWWPIIREPFSGAWQRNIEVSQESVLSFSAVYACVTLIASDIAKMGIRLVQLDGDGIWNEVTSPAFSPVLRKPNAYQTRIKFFEQWITSKLIWGNAYVLKGRDARNVVTSLQVLDPQRVKVLVAPNGDIYYQLNTDNLTGVDEAVTVPASEIIHDVMVALYHPLCGVSPITACGMAAMQGLRVQAHSESFFSNGANPGGVLETTGQISPELAKRLEENWNSNYGGVNSGKVAVLGDGLVYKPMTMSAVDSQLIEQLKWTAENVCTAFHVPPFMIGVAPPPPYNNVQALNQQYYSQALQTHIESIELLLDEGLGLDKQAPTLGTEFDLDSLLRMDTATLVTAAADAVKSGNMAPNESRKRFFGLGKKIGGDSLYLQQQNYSTEALAKRDAKADPFETSSERPDPGPDAPPEPPEKSEKVLQFMAKAAIVEYTRAAQQRRSA